MPAIALELIDVAKRFGPFWALKNVNLQIEAGEFIALLGSSGSGKSTLLNIIAGLEAPSAGQVMLNGRDAAALSPADRNLAMVFQSCALYPSLTVRRNLSFGLEMRGISTETIHSRVASMARQLGIEALLDRKPEALSGGQKQRVAIGRALVREPAIFLLDEPLSGLDTVLRASLRIELKRLHEHTASTFVYVTHDAAEAMTLATRIAVLDRGRVVQFDCPRTVYTRPATLFVAGLVGSPPINLIEGTCCGSSRLARASIEIGPARLSLACGAEAGALEGGRVIAGFRPEDVRFVAAAPEDTFRGRVLSVESTGPDRYARIMLSDHQIIARLPDGLKLEGGAEIPFSIDKSAVSLFCPADGRRLN